jgi:hypothetical protein
VVSITVTSGAPHNDRIPQSSSLHAEHRHRAPAIIIFIFVDRILLECLLARSEECLSPNDPDNCDADLDDRRVGRRARFGERQGVV